jgi:hypothetical protein
MMLCSVQESPLATSTSSCLCEGQTAATLCRRCGVMRSRCICCLVLTLVAGSGTGPLAGALRRAAYWYRQPTSEQRLRVGAAWLEQLGQDGLKAFQVRVGDALIFWHVDVTNFRSDLGGRSEADVHNHHSTVDVLITVATLGAEVA